MIEDDEGDSAMDHRPVHDLSDRAAARRVARLAAALAAAGGLAVTAGCAPDAAGAPGTAVPAPTTSAAPAPGTPAQGTPAQGAAPASPTAPAPPDPAADGVLELGESGPAVVALQQRLSDLGYWLGEVDGWYGQLTRQAVMAFQKAEGLTRDGVAGPQTQGRLPEATRPTARATSGDLLEVDLERQLLLVVQDGQVRWAFNTSTGNGELYEYSGGTAVASTPKGEYAIQRQIDGLREAELGTLYRPKYFNGGIAVHGSGSIPARPASHGCVRLTNAAMDLLWSSGVAEIGTTVLVY
ncbi:L,D-transpeptidase family protein [Pseudonocardia nigra]|uniref:L,D-transpeptidase family protein n=1 Tax=Pseudonocardia nigra TaxID=1921578 RepID=UPI001C604169|nr:L,D-transpeptidase family protein [Pseudonocardia nigra]